MKQFPTYLVVFLSFASFFTFSGCSSIPFFGESDDPAVQAQERHERYQTQLEDARDRGEVVLGMPMRDVRNLWGNPVEVDPAGDTAHGNERWIYREGFSNVGLESSRVLYFENGRLAGWQTVSNP